MLTISHLSRQWVYAEVEVDRREHTDLFPDPVHVAFPQVGEDPGSGDWQVAEWAPRFGAPRARCLVGPGGTVTLDAGEYEMWVKVTADPEEPVLKAGRVVVT